MEQYQKGYQNAIDDFQNKLKLRSRDVVINKGSTNSNHPSSSQPNTEKQIENKKEISKEVRPPIPVDVDRETLSFNLQYELFNINISIPFNELLRNNEYREKIIKMIKNQGGY